MNLFLRELCGGRMDHLDNFPRTDPIWQSGKLLESTFTELVDSLRNPDSMKNPAINELARLLWRLVGNRIVPSSVMPGIPTMSFWCEIKKGEMFATIICPLDWPQRLKDDPYMQMGAMVFNASRARDYWNHRIIDITDTKEEQYDRAMAFEAELLCYFQQHTTDFVPNEYQKQVLEKFPAGLASAPPGLVYESRPFPDGQAEMLLAGPPYPVDVYNLNKK